MKRIFLKLFLLLTSVSTFGQYERIEPKMDADIPWTARKLSRHVDTAMEEFYDSIVIFSQKIDNIEAGEMSAIPIDSVINLTSSLQDKSDSISQNDADISSNSSLISINSVLIDNVTDTARAVMDSVERLSDSITALRNDIGTGGGNGNATSIMSSPVTTDTKTDGSILVYRSLTGDWEYEQKPASGSNPAASDVTLTPYGGISSINVQSGIQELDDEKEPADATILKDADIGVSVQAFDIDLVSDASYVSRGDSVINNFTRIYEQSDSLTAIYDSISRHTDTLIKLSNEISSNKIRIKEISDTIVNFFDTISYAGGGGGSFSFTPDTLTLLNPEFTTYANKFQVNLGDYDSWLFDTANIVVIGSSTGVGNGSYTDFSCAEIFESYLNSVIDSLVFTNLSLGGQVTYDILPNGYTDPDGVYSVDPARNVTYAVDTLNADMIAVIMPSNDQASATITAVESSENFRHIVDYARSRGVYVILADIAPRTSITAQKQWDLGGNIRNNYWNILAPTYSHFTESDYSWVAQYAQDGIHPNPIAHQLIGEQLIKQFNAVADQEVDIKRIEIECSAYNTDNFTFVRSMHISERYFYDYNITADSTYYYRARAVGYNLEKSVYSDTLQVNAFVEANPALLSANVGNVDSITLRLTFDINTACSGIAGISFVADSGALSAVSVAGGSGTTVIDITLSRPVKAQETITMTIAGTNDFENSATQAQFLGVTDFNVTNTVASGFESQAIFVAIADSVQGIGLTNWNIFHFLAANIYQSPVLPYRTATFVDSTGASTTVYAEISEANDENDFGAKGASGGNYSLLQDTVLHRNWWLTSISPDYYCITIKGLESSANYEIEMTGSRTGTGDRPSRFAILPSASTQVGSETDVEIIDVIENTTLTAKVQGSSSSGGELIIGISNDSGELYCYLAGFVIRKIQ